MMYEKFRVRAPRRRSVWSDDDEAGGSAGRAGCRARRQGREAWSLLVWRWRGSRCGFPGLDDFFGPVGCGSPVRAASTAEPLVNPSGMAPQLARGLSKRANGDRPRTRPHRAPGDRGRQLLAWAVIVLVLTSLLILVLARIVSLTVETARCCRVDRGSVFSRCRQVQGEDDGAFFGGDRCWGTRW